MLVMNMENVGSGIDRDRQIEIDAQMISKWNSYYKKRLAIRLNTYIKGLCVLITKSGFEFLYTNLELVCSHCH